MELGLAGKVAVVTGGSEGIGRAAAMRLSEEGARVAICARREDLLHRAAAEIRAKTDGDVLAVRADVSRPEDCARFVERAVNAFDRIDILVNNAGRSAAAPFEQVPDEVWAADLELKLLGAVRMARLVVPHMRKQGGGRIINMTTIGGKAPGRGSLPTSVSRAAGINLTKALANEYAGEQILVNTICLGKIKSAQWERFRETQAPNMRLEDFYAARGRDIPVGRIGEAEEVADLVAFLASDRARYITGVAINIDGGLSAVV
jgi:NAD(P)-dependent dehydrogenase (short-subunit alcohol dehydrogenase family)